MLLICLLFIVCPFFVRFGLSQSLANWAQPFHATCLKLAPSLAQSEHASLYRGIVCGESLHNLHEASHSFKILGLIHILVVSGSHLVLLAKAMELLLRPLNQNSTPRMWISLLKLSVLGVYVLLANAQAPVLRGFLAQTLVSLNHKFKLFWTSAILNFYGGCLLLISFPQLYHSLSLILSWLCALALTTPIQNPLLKNTFIFVALYFPLSLFSSPHPISILCNTLIAPFIGSILFPLSALVFIIPSLTPLVDSIWTGVVFVLENITPEVLTQSLNLNIEQTKPWLWAYVIFLNLLLIWWQRWQKLRIS